MNLLSSTLAVNSLRPIWLWLPSTEISSVYHHVHRLEKSFIFVLFFLKTDLLYLFIYVFGDRVSLYPVLKLMKTRLALNSEISTPLNPGCWEKDFKNNNQKEKKPEISQPGIWSVTHNALSHQASLLPRQQKQQTVFFLCTSANMWYGRMAKITASPSHAWDVKAEKRLPPKSVSTWNCLR